MIRRLIHPVTDREIVCLAAIPAGSADVVLADPVALAEVRWIPLDQLDALLPTSTARSASGCAHHVAPARAHGMRPVQSS